MWSLQVAHLLLVLGQRAESFVVCRTLGPLLRCSLQSSAAAASAMYPGAVAGCFDLQAQHSVASLGQGAETFSTMPPYTLCGDVGIDCCGGSTRVVGL